MRKHGELFDSSSDDNDQGAIVDTDNKDDNNDDDVDDDDGVGYRRQTRGCRFVPRSQLSRSHNPFQPALYHSACHTVQCSLLPWSVIQNNAMRFCRTHNAVIWTSLVIEKVSMQIFQKLPPVQHFRQVQCQTNTTMTKASVMQCKIIEMYCHCIPM